MLEKVARTLNKATQWIITVVLAAIFIGAIANIFATIPSFTTFITWSIQSGVFFIVVVGVVLVYLGTLLLSNSIAGGNSLWLHLKDVVEQNNYVDTQGYSQQLKALTSIQVAVQDVYFPLKMISDFPINDTPEIPDDTLESIRQNTTMSEEEKNLFIQGLQASRYLQTIPDIVENGAKQKVTIEELIQQLNASHSLAVILGMPGSGKTMLMRWLALQMAFGMLQAKYPDRLGRIRSWLARTWQRLSRSPQSSKTGKASKSSVSGVLVPPSYRFPTALGLQQIPLLIRVKEYVKFLALTRPVKPDQVSLEDFLTEKLAKKHASLPAKIRHELEQGHCLVLLDGIDEVPDASMYQDVLDNIKTFINTYQKTSRRGEFNRFIINSRIVGYKPINFGASSQLHYTLLELDISQIEVGLPRWCDAVWQARYLINQHKSLSLNEEEQWQERSQRTQKDLLNAIYTTPSLRSLASNPLMLTGLISIQIDGRMLPQRRIELYRTLTESLLHTWNLEGREKIRRTFAALDEVQVAEEVLSELAYYLHTERPMLLLKDVIRITQDVLGRVHEGQQVSENDAREFIETVQESSGLFVESGQGLYCFIHRSFQEYYVARYLLREPSNLEAFVVKHYPIARWREPLLLAIAYQDIENREQASALIQTIADTNDGSEAILHRSLLFATNCIVDCGVFTISKKTQKDVAERLFCIYGDILGAGRYSQLRADIEHIALLWLGTQTQSGTLTDNLPPLLEIWRGALTNEDAALCQQGATQLLSALAPGLRSRGQRVLNALIPPLLQLAKLTDLPMPPEMKGYLPSPPIHTDSAQLEAYAYIALRSLDEAGPAGWLHTDWLPLSEQQPALLTRLSDYANQLGFLLTPAAFPAASDITNWENQIAQGETWLNRDQDGVDSQLQNKLLHFSKAARYPMAHFLLTLLKEVDPPQHDQDERWIAAWDALLAKEMEKGHSATYHCCFLLRLLLCREDETKRQQLVNELMHALELPSDRPQASQAFMAVTYIYLLNLLNLRSLLEHLKVRDIAALRRLRGKFQEQAGKVLQDMFYNNARLDRLSVHDRLNAPVVRYLHHDSDLLDVEDILLLLYSDQTSDVQMPKHIDLMVPLAFRELYTVRYQRELREILLLLDSERILDLLCQTLVQPAPEHVARLALLALHSVLATFSTPQNIPLEKIEEALHHFSERHNPLSKELLLLTTAIRHLISIGLNGAVKHNLPHKEADEHAERLQHLCSSHANTLNSSPCVLSAKAIQEILNACTDTSPLSDDKQRELSAATVQQVALKLLPQQYLLDDAAFAAIVQIFDGKHDTIACASAALLLQYNKAPTPQLCETIAARLENLLTNDALSHRPLDILGNNSPRYLDDFLFDTYKIVAERIAELNIAAHSTSAQASNETPVH